MTRKLDILFIGCIRMSRNLLLPLLDHPHCRVVGVACRATPGGHDDFEPLAPLAETRGIPVLFLDREKDRLRAWARELAPDVGYCFGLSMLLPQELLAVPELGCALDCCEPFRNTRTQKVPVYETLSETDQLPGTAPLFAPNVFVDIGEHPDSELRRHGIYDTKMAQPPFPRSAEAVKAFAGVGGAAAGCEFAEASMLHQEVL